MQILATSESRTAATVLALIDVSPADATQLINALRRLSAPTATPLEIAPSDSAGGQVRLIARVALADVGCHAGSPASGTSVVYCDLTPGTWEQVTGLLDPFSRRQQMHAHQYLSEHGPITWIASTDSTW